MVKGIKLLVITAKGVFRIQFSFIVKVIKFKFRIRRMVITVIIKVIVKTKK